MKKSLRSLLLATALVSISYSAAFAEMIYNRGNSADPETLDPHKTSTVYEAHILHSGRRRELEGFRRRHRLHLQPAQGRDLVERRPRHRR